MFLKPSGFENMLSVMSWCLISIWVIGNCLRLQRFKSHNKAFINRPTISLSLFVSGGLWAGVSDGEEGGGAGGADGLVEDDVRNAELLKCLSGWWSDHPHIDVIYSTFCVPVYTKKNILSLICFVWFWSLFKLIILFIIGMVCLILL